MAHEVRGVIARSKGSPVSVEPIHVPDPGPGEVVVDVQACGVCHTDLHYREGAINDEFPFLLGHEAAGVVSQVGSGVGNVKEGDFVTVGQCQPLSKTVRFNVLDVEHSINPINVKKAFRMF